MTTSSTFLIPKDISVDKIYKFYIRIIASGGAMLVTTEKTLVVGCTSLISIKNSQEFESYKLF